MPTRRPSPKTIRRHALVFSALGEETRLTLLTRLSGGASLSITQLADSSSLTRQAITKHLAVLQQVGLVRSTRRGRENLFRFDPAPLDAARDSLANISRQWDDALARLKAFVEKSE